MSRMMAGVRVPYLVSRSEERRVIVASSIGTVFEWYDFFLYAVLAQFFAKLFFPPGNDTGALLAAFATYALGFLVRPFGAAFLGRLGDLTGRKFTFLLSIFFMGISTFTVGLLPTFAQAGWIASIMLVLLRVLQGLALGGEYGGAATYVAEYTETSKRGYATSWIQTTGTLGIFLALAVIGLCRSRMSEAAFDAWGWRLPFLLSIFLLFVSIYIRVSLRETPVYLRMKAEGRRSKIPLWESLSRYPNNKLILLSLLGSTTGQAVVWYTSQFYTLFFLTIVLRLDYLIAYVMVSGILLAGIPFFVFFGWLSDRVGRLRIILTGFLLAALTYFFLFGVLAEAVNPALTAFQRANRITLLVDKNTCHLHILPWSNFTRCDQIKDYLARSGLSFKVRDTLGLDGALVTIGAQTVEITGTTRDEIETTLDRALFGANYPGLVWKYAGGEPQLDAHGNPLFSMKGADPAHIHYVRACLALFVMMLYATMVYGPSAAFLVELFPARIRYTSLSISYHIGNGLFGGMLPLIATAIVAATGNIYAGLWYPVILAGVSCVIGALFLRDRRGQPIWR